MVGQGWFPGPLFKHSKTYTMKIKSIVPGEGHNYKITLENGAEWELDWLGFGDGFEYEIRLNVGISRNPDELREQGKAMVTFSFIIDALNEMIPDMDWESEDDDYELMIYAFLNIDQIMELILKI